MGTPHPSTHNYDGSSGTATTELEMMIIIEKFKQLESGRFGY